MDVHRIAEIVKGSGPAGMRPAIRLRQGTVQTVNEDGTIDVTIGGGSTVVSCVACFDHVSPVAAAGVWLITDGVDMIALGTIS